jgi:hypothetical protein
VTDHIPNDLSHLSDAEFNSLCPQGEHAPGPQPLSPAAQAVQDAAWTTYDDDALYFFTAEQHAGKIAAAALRAVAHNVYSDEIVTCGGSSYALVIEQDDILAIADELERQ